MSPGFQIVPDLAPLIPIHLNFTTAFPQRGWAFQSAHELWLSDRTYSLRWSNSPAICSELLLTFDFACYQQPTPYPLLTVSLAPAPPSSSAFWLSLN